MGIKIYDAIDYAGETVLLLPRLQAGETLEKDMERYKQRFSPEILGELFGPALELERDAARLLPQDEEGLFLLAKDENVLPPIILFWARRFFAKEPRRNRAFYAFSLFHDNDEEGDKKDFEFLSDAAFFAWVDGLAIKPEEKQKFLRLYFNYGAYERRYDRFVADVTELIKAHEPAFEPLRKRAMEQLRARVAEKGVRFCVECGLNLDESSDYALHILLSSPNSMSLYGRNGAHTLVALVGCCLFEWIEQLLGNPIAPQEFCKTLSDPTKHSILRLLKGGKLYAAQIAQQLNLTSATISHHMSALVAQHLVSLSKDGNRIYYERNEDVLREGLRQLEHWL